MVAGNRLGKSSRSSSPDPKSTNSEVSAPKTEYTGNRQSPAGCFRAKPQKPAPERNEDTIAESDTSELATTSLDYMRENLQSIIDSSICDGPCQQSSPPPPPVYLEPQRSCGGNEVNVQRCPVRGPEQQPSQSPARASQEPSPPPSQTARNKSPASCFKTKLKRPAPPKSQQSPTQSTASEAPKRQPRGKTKKSSVKEAACTDTTEESVTYETPPKSIEFMRESLQNIIDNSMCDEPCCGNVTVPAPVCPADSWRAPLTATEPSRCNFNPGSHPATPAESFYKPPTTCDCNQPSFSVTPVENYSVCGGSSGVANQTTFPITQIGNNSSRGGSNCVCYPVALPVTTMENSPVHGVSNCACNSTEWPEQIESYPVRGPSSCICDPTLCPISTSTNLGYNPNVKVFPPTPNDTCNECNLPFSAPPEEECPCDCEPGPESTCYAKRSAFERFKGMFSRASRPGNASCQNQSQNPYYTFKQDNVRPLPRRLVFNLVDGIPSGSSPCQKPPPPPRKVVRKEEKIERIVANSSVKGSFDRYTNKVDIYYFDHGNSGYYRTTDNPPPLMTDEFLEKSDRYATEFWANIFGVCHVGISYVVIFFLQLYRFLCYSLIRSLIVGFIQISADYVFKPIFSIFFNGIIQTIFILLFNMATSFRDLCEPLAHSIGFFLRELAHVFRAIRLVELNNVHTQSLGHSPKGERCKQVPTPSRCGPCGTV